MGGEIGVWCRIHLALAMPSDTPNTLRGLMTSPGSTVPSMATEPRRRLRSCWRGWPHGVGSLRAAFKCVDEQLIGLFVGLLFGHFHGITGIPSPEHRGWRRLLTAPVAIVVPGNTIR